jgi:hypothetical protein
MKEKIKDTGNSNIIYGVDITKKVTPIMVRDAIIQCYYEAHRNVLELAKETFGNPPKKRFDEMKRSVVKDLISDIFVWIGGDFNNPTKKDLFKVIDILRRFAAIYRSEKIIKKHFTEILLLIEKL